MFFCRKPKLNGLNGMACKEKWMDGKCNIVFFLNIQLSYFLHWNRDFGRGLNVAADAAGAASAACTFLIINDVKIIKK